MLLGRREAAKRLGRSPLTVRDWELRGHLRVAKRDEYGRALYESRALLECARRMRANYLNRDHVPGTGRGRLHPRTEDITAMIRAGESTKDIAAGCECSISTVRRKKRALKSTQTPENDSGG